ncbi:MAG: VOC family protein [Azospirillaceae bacterium]|nr:VOC family protein [Azospirillaceae bacterium]
MSNKPHSIHHVNFPMRDRETTKEWYCKVFSMKWVDPKSNTDVLLLTRGGFDLHFTPVPEDQWHRMAPSHFAIEVEDWDGFLAHLNELKVRHSMTVERPQNNSRYCYIADPNGHTIELTYHGKLHTEASVKMEG